MGRAIRRIGLCLGLVGGLAGGAQAQQASGWDPAQALNVAEAVAERLRAQGFENLSVGAFDGGLLVSYENRTYRHQARALQEVIRHTMPALERGQQLMLVPRRHDVPMARIALSVDDYLAVMDARMTTEQFVRSFDISVDTRPPNDVEWLVQGAHPARLKFDVVVHPQVKVSLGNFNDPVESQVNVAPALTTSLWPGMRLAAQLVVPLQNELDEGDDYVRPGLLTVTQFVKLAPKTVLAATAGYFSENRYGFDVALQHRRANGRWALHANGGYTGYASFLKGEWLYSDPELFTYAAGLRYHLWTRKSLWVALTYGRFLYQDAGWRLDATRRFGEVEIGFFGVATGRGENIGVQLAVPLFPGKYARPTRVRMRPARRVDWTYFYRKLENAGDTYTTGTGIEDFLEGFTPALLINDLIRLDNWR